MPSLVSRGAEVKGKRKNEDSAVLVSGDEGRAVLCLAAPAFSFTSDAERQARPERMGKSSFGGVAYRYYCLSAAAGSGGDACGSRGT